ncbi:MAG: nuclear transport factor 2 family protein [Candidatus Binatia bacterium]
MNDQFSSADQQVIALWERHLAGEFVDRDATATLATMTEDPYVNHVPVMTGGSGREELRAFYAEHFLVHMPADTTVTLVSRTVGQERIIDELIFRFTHDIEMDWMLPGVPPTGRQVEVPFVVVVQLRGDKIACERIYWDQASVLVQLGLLDPSRLPIAGAETARKVLNPSLPSNELMSRSTSEQR